MYLKIIIKQTCKDTKKLRAETKPFGLTPDSATPNLFWLPCPEPEEAKLVGTMPGPEEEVQSRLDVAEIGHKGYSGLTLPRQSIFNGIQDTKKLRAETKLATKAIQTNAKEIEA